MPHCQRPSFPVPWGESEPAGLGRLIGRENNVYPGASGQQLCTWGFSWASEGVYACAHV